MYQNVLSIPKKTFIMLTLSLHNQSEPELSAQILFPNSWKNMTSLQMWPVLDASSLCKRIFDWLIAKTKLSKARQAFISRKDYCNKQINVQCSIT